MFQRIERKKIHDNTVQSSTLWLTLSKIDFFFNQQMNKGKPSFHFHAPGSKRRYPRTQSIGCPKIVPSSAPVFYWLSHLTCILNLEAKNRVKNIDFHSAKNVPKEVVPFFFYF